MNPKSHPWRRFTLALLVLGALFVGACSSDSGDDAAPGGTGGETTVSDADPNGVVRVGYDLVQGSVAADVDPLNAKQNTANNDSMWFAVHGRLLRTTLDGSYAPELAESVEVVDSSTIDVVLKDGLVFSDGSSLTAESAKASFEAVLANRENNTLAYLEAYYSLQSVTVTGPTSFTLSFADGAAPSWYDQYIANFGSSIFKLAADGTWDQTVSSGPFTIVERNLGTSWKFTKNPEFWNAANVKFGGIELVNVLVAEAQSGLAAIQSGQVDVTYTEPSLLSSLSGSVEEVAVVSPNVASMMHICKAEGPLADARVRKAINKAMDREAISEAVYFGTAEPQLQPWPAGHRLNNPDVEGELAYDPEGARQLLEEAGYGDGVTIDMYPIQAFNLDEVGEVLQAQLAEVGITVNIVPTPDYVNQFLTPEVRAVGLYPSLVPGPQKLAAWTGNTQGNVCKYHDDELDALVAQLRQVSEASDEAADLWHQIDKLVVDDALSGFIVFRSDLAAYDTDRIGDMQPVALGNFIIPDWYVSYVKTGS